MFQEIFKYRSYADNFDISVVSGIEFVSPKPELKKDLPEIIKSLLTLSEQAKVLLGRDSFYGVSKVLDNIISKADSALRHYNNLIKIESEPFLKSLYVSFGKKEDEGPSGQDDYHVDDSAKAESESLFYVNCLRAFSLVKNLKEGFSKLTETGNLERSSLSPE